MKKVLYLVVAFVLMLVSLCCVSCMKSTPRVIKESDTYFIINVTDKVEEGTTLYDYMLTLRDDEQIAFTDANGMITSINGIENAVDWSACWMLYTTDADNCNVAYGQVKYNDKVYGSSNWGAESLLIKKGESYIWLYQSFEN